jgi:hypothetical protein
VKASSDITSKDSSPFIDGIFKEFDDTTLKISNPSYLISDRGGVSQTFHYDYPQPSAIDDAQSGYFVMIAFMNGTTNC